MADSKPNIIWLIKTGDGSWEEVTQEEWAEMSRNDPYHLQYAEVDVEDFNNCDGYTHDSELHAAIVEVLRSRAPEAV